MRKQPNVAVVGGGVVGLTLARLVQDQNNIANVTVFAEQFTETTSYMADGIFRPRASFKAPVKKLTNRWILDSWDYWQTILKSPEGPKTGVLPVNALIFSKENESVVSNPFPEYCPPYYQPVNAGDFKLAPRGTKYGSSISTLKVECEVYLPWVERKIIDAGGKLVKTKIESLSSLANFDLVFNCSGLGAKYLCNDNSLVPIRSQVLKVVAPWLKTAFFGDCDTYIIPGLNGLVTLGGVRHYNSSNTEYSRNDMASTMERCCELLPDLRGCEIVGYRVGLRPHRVPVRVEGEVVDGLKVVHCYGHGACGVATAPGTAGYAIAIACSMLDIHI